MIMYRQMYEKEIYRQRDHEVYKKKLANDPTQSIRKQLEEILKQALKEGTITHYV